MTYRFAKLAYFSVCVLCGLDVFPLPVMKGIIVRHLVYWLNMPIRDNSGILTIGYAYPNLQMSESYNAPGSPYWALKAFLFLALPDEHPFWRVRCAPMPDLEPLKYLPRAGMLIQRSGDHVVSLVPGRRVSDGHSHTLEKYAKFAYSSRFGFSIMRSNLTLAECAPDSTLVFRVYGYLFPKDVIEEEYEISERGLRFSWSPIRGIHVRTSITPTRFGHIRRHEIESDIPADIPCEAYDCGFALSTDDRRIYDRHSSQREAVVKNEEGYCLVRSLAGDGRGEILIPDPNTNLIHPKTTIPVAAYSIRRGKNVIETELLYM